MLSRKISCFLKQFPLFWTKAFNKRMKRTIKEGVLRDLTWSQCQTLIWDLFVDQIKPRLSSHLKRRKAQGTTLRPPKASRNVSWMKDAWKAIHGAEVSLPQCLSLLVCLVNIKKEGQKVDVFTGGKRRTQRKVNNSCGDKYIL